MSRPVDPWWPEEPSGPVFGEGPPDPGFAGGGFRSSEEDTNYGGYGPSGEKTKDTRNTREIAVQAAETTKKIKDDLAFIKERLRELVDETSTHEQERASLEKRLVGDEEYSPTIPNQDLFAIDVDKLIKDLGEVFRTEKKVIQEDGFTSARSITDVLAAHVGNVLWEHLRLPSELYDAWVEAADCGLGKK